MNICFVLNYVYLNDTKKETGYFIYDQRKTCQARQGKNTLKSKVNKKLSIILPTKMFYKVPFTY